MVMDRLRITEQIRIRHKARTISELHNPFVFMVTYKSQGIALDASKLVVVILLAVLQNG